MLRLRLFIFFIFFYSFMALGQEKIVWKAGYNLSVLDFQAEPPVSREGLGQTFYLAAALDISKPLNKEESRQIKNFNRKVRVYFVPALSWLNQGEGTEILLKQAQMEFDVLELYARKLRQQLYLKNKTANSPDILQQVYQEISSQMSIRRAEMLKAVSESDADGNAFHNQILREIHDLAGYCQECDLP